MRVLFLFLPMFSLGTKWDDLKLDSLHLKYSVQSDKGLLESCKADSGCPVETENPRCWGFEEDCPFEKSYSAELSLPACEKGKEGLRDTFCRQTDWGYVRERAELQSICESDDEEGSSLRCSKQLQYCYARNVFFDFRHFVVEGSKRYRNDIILEGDVGGNCKSNFNRTSLRDNLGQKSYLQSWGHELEHFDSNPTFKVEKSQCDVIFDGPVVLQKQDASVNMYHHFCDFINLYASQHINGSFSRDVRVIWWDTAQTGFVDSTFGVTWKVFSKSNPLELVSMAGKRVCFREVMLPLLARMPFGLFYNMPMVQGCAGSGLMHAFSHHVLHRLGVPRSMPLLESVRVVILSRSTTHRRILNMDELEAAVRSLPGVELRVVDYNHKMPFLDQLRSTQSADVFIGMHGAGLTHLLFLPDWAVIFELYHCEDRGCYRDLARLRGVKYFTWPDDKIHLILPDNADEKREKFVNYTFDANEVKRQVQKMVEWVRRNPKFVEARRLRKRIVNKLEL